MMIFKITKTSLVWIMWIVAVMFFAFTIYWAPGTSDDRHITGPEFFLSFLGQL